MRRTSCSAWRETTPIRRIRGEALFWLAQKAGSKVAGTITDAIDKDPDTEVKKRAVFALSQLPKDEGVPLLINVARTNTEPGGPQAGDVLARPVEGPAGIEFFAEILK